MLMMRAGWRPMPRASPADAHDARWLAAICQEPAQLMLMMRAGWWPMPRASPADAHDARWLVAYAKSLAYAKSQPS